MMAIIVFACLSADPSRCEAQDLGMIEAQGFKACRLQIEPVVADWQKSHPGLILQTAYCMPMRSARAN